METLTKSFEKKDKIPQSVKILDQIEGAKNNADLEKIRELMPDFFAALENDAGIELTPDVHRIYNSIDKGNCIVRLGNLPHITSALAGQDNLKIGNEDDYYPNALKGSYEAVKDAFEEGHYNGPIRPVIGFGEKDPELAGVSFRADDVEVLDRSNLDYSHPQAITDPNTYKKNRKKRFLCVRGELKRGELKHLAMRIPSPAVPDSVQTKEEIKSDSRFIFRGAML
ncbi:MAG: hypothetical protein BRC25_01635 [Parcubacteria group bacterium SW_6_46_9]|nr:MAG: hypothetical protein BRC25_01635 [Parcubacteria group bacterium SW_6_46_9]